MPTTEYYQKYIAQLPFGAERKEYQVLCNHVGERNAISLRDLTRLCFGGVFSTTTERQCREAIEVLRRDYGVPVLSHSGKPGRWLAANHEELQQTVSEMETRRRHLDQVIQALRQARIPSRDPFAEKHVQEGLF